MIVRPEAGRWYCSDCDVLYNEYRTLVHHWTAGPAPAVCPNCDEQVCLVIWEDGRPQFVSIPMPKREAAVLQRHLQEGGFCSPERGRELKRQMTGSNTMPWTAACDQL
jgi:hypothetical protein